MGGVACRIEMVVARHRPHGFQAFVRALER
jgi:hypothetical protein